MWRWGYVWLCVGLLLVGRTWAGDNQWTSIGPLDGLVAAVAVDPATPTRLYVAPQRGGLRRSTDGGQTWQSVADLASLMISFLVLDPVTPTTLYAGTHNEGIFAITIGPQMQCVWGLYLDDHRQGGSWESRLFMANLDTQTPHNYHIVVLAINGIFQKYVQLAPSEVASFPCDDFVACGTAGWLTVRADTPVFGATLFVINTLFGGGSFTAQPPVCTLLPP